MAADPDLQLRGQLVRRLGRFREMLPGSFGENKRPCGRPNCHCADGKSLHTQYQISVLVDGQPKTFHVPKGMVDQVREKIQLRQRFEAAGGAIGKINLRRFLKESEKSSPSRAGTGSKRIWIRCLIFLLTWRLCRTGASIPTTAVRRSLMPCFWERLVSFAHCIAWRRNANRAGCCRNG